MKYELTNEEKTVDGRTLYRIRYLQDIPYHYIQKGDLGGWLESTSNLAHTGMCAVLDDAEVFGNAQVQDDAIVRDNVRVYGYASVRGSAMLTQKVRVYDQAIVTDTRLEGHTRVSRYAILFGKFIIRSGHWRCSPLVIYGAAERVHTAGTNDIAIGCRINPYTWWVKNAESLALEYDLDDDKLAFYKFLVETAQNFLQMKLATGELSH